MTDPLDPLGFLGGSVIAAAPALLGWTLRHGETAGVVVETEAYHQDEPACHAYVGRTARTSTLFGAPGTAYVYRSYGIHALVNVVCEPEDVGAAVLIRALEPSAGLDAMRERRGVADDEQLCSGPGKLTQALDVGLELNATSFVAGPLALEPPARPVAPERVVVSAPRIGITRGVELPWRFSLRGSRHVSKPWPPGLEAPRRR